MKIKKKTPLIQHIVCLLLIILCFFQMYQIITSYYIWSITTSGFVKMWAEILIWGGIILCANIFAVKSNKSRFIFNAGILVLAAYLHEMLLPFLVICGYLVFLVLFGMFLNYLLIRKKVHPLIHFLSGTCGLLIAVEVLSFFKIGSIHNIRIFCLLCFFCLLVWDLANHKKIGLSMGRSKAQSVEKLSVVENALLSICILVVVIQLARANIQGDYDSLWYGLRSEFVLNTGTGIYEDLGLTGFIYIYPKGFEILALPVSGTDSYGYIFMLNIALALLAPIIAWLTSKEYLPRKQALLITALVATLPVIMNMGVTAKSDVSTAVFQMLGIYLIWLFFKKQDLVYLFSGLSALILTYTMKVMSIPYTTFILIAVILLCCKNRKMVCTLPGKRAAWLLTLPIFSVLGVIYRSWKLSGLPFFLLFDFFSALGFHVKYPFAENGSFSMGGISYHDYLKKLYTYFIAPTADPTSHTILAWGTGIVFAIWVLYLLFAKKQKDKSNEAVWLKACYIAVLLAAAASLVIIAQCDGNYMMLLSCMTVIVPGGQVLLADTVKPASGRRTRTVLCVFLLSNFLLLTLSNWAWALGLSPVRLINNGRSSQKTKQYEAYVHQNGNQIWSLLNESRQNKCAVFGGPDILAQMPCTAIMNLDITKYGDPEILSSADSFAEYLQYASYQYVLISNGSVEKDSHEADLLYKLLSTGIVRDLIWDDGGNLLLCLSYDEHVNLDSDYISQFAQAFYTGTSIRTGQLVDGFYTWEEGNQQWIHTAQTAVIRLKTGTQHRLVLSANTYEMNLPNVLHVYFNDELIYEKAINETDISFDICSEKIPSNVSGELKLELDYAKSPTEAGTGDDSRPIGMTIGDLWFE